MLTDLKKNILHYYYQFRKEVELKKIVISSEKRNLFLMQTPTHSNLGDHAIAVAQIDFLKTNFLDDNLVEVNQSLLDDFIQKYKDRVSKNDVILIHGGGNFGNQYLREENWRRKIIENFPDNTIVSFPQTIYYTNNEKGASELALTRKVIESHPNLILIAREKVSFEKMKDCFPNTNVLLTPDIVLSINIRNSQIRNGVLLALRNDPEKILTEQNHLHIDLLVKKYFEQITYADMHYHENIVSKLKRDEALNQKFLQFQKAEVVITDRLHGMVFAAITATPCIAFSNYNQKVSGTFEWIKNLNYIKFISPDSDIESVLKELMELQQKTVYDPSVYQSYFQQIVKKINE